MKVLQHGADIAEQGKNAFEEPTVPHDVQHVFANVLVCGLTIMHTCKSIGVLALMSFVKLALSGTPANY